jgi:hypothetical protein
VSLGSQKSNGLEFLVSENLKNWQPRPRPERKVIDGRYVRLEPLSAAKHGDGLYEASSVSDIDGRFAWLPDYPPETRAAFQPWLDKVEADELGYRRYEWKCNNRNEPSKRAAERFGFTFEGIFRQHLVVKGENRDTAWYSIIDKEWPTLRRAYEAWLDPANFDGEGQQKRRLEDFRAEFGA